MCGPCPVIRRTRARASKERRANVSDKQQVCKALLRAERANRVCRSGSRRLGDARRMREGKTMKRVMRILCFGLVLTATAFAVSAGPAQDGADVKVVFERAIP